MNEFDFSGLRGNQVLSRGIEGQMESAAICTVYDVMPNAKIDNSSHIEYSIVVYHNIFWVYSKLGGDICGRELGNTCTTKEP